MSDKYLVVGATGSIGSNLAEQLHASGKEIHLVGRNENNTIEPLFFFKLP